MLFRSLAGLFSFAVNIILASILVFRFKGSGIAFALSAASAVNTVLLLVFLKKNPAITVSKTLKTSIAYTAKLILLSGIAVVPVLFLSPFLSALFAGNGRIVSQGAPLLINALIYAAAGILLLAATRDKQFLAIVRMIRRRK